jgi:DNA mismatch repair protein MutS
MTNCSSITATTSWQGYIFENNSGIAFLDISTGDFFVAEGNIEYLDKLLQSLRPAEVIFQRQCQKQFKENFGLKFYTYTLESWIFDEAYCTECLLKHFQTHSLKGFGIDDLRAGIIAAGAVLQYLKDTEHPNLQHITSIQRLEKDDYLWMDKFTIRNLELLYSPIENGMNLLRVMDNTVSPMGARLLKRWMIMPLLDIHKINERLDAVEFIIKQVDLRNSLMQLIKLCGDVERLISKIPVKKINPREVLHLARGLHNTEKLRSSARNLEKNTWCAWPIHLIPVTTSPKNSQGNCREPSCPGHQRRFDQRGSSHSS